MKYSVVVNERVKEFDSDSVTNQEILRRLVEREVLCSVNNFVEFVQKNQYLEDVPFAEEDIFNAEFKSCGECGESEFEEMEIDDLEEHVFLNPDSECGYEDRFICPVCGETWETLEEAKNCCCNEMVWKCVECGKIYTQSEYDDLCYEYREPLEYWAVSNWFAGLLKERGEYIIESDDFMIWGRTTSGQSIYADGVIQQIAYEIEILEGQVYEWKI